MEYKTYIVNDKKVNVRIDRQAPMLGKGYESIVYLVQGKAFKLYRSYMLDKHNLGEKECHYLREIPTRRVLLPDQPIYDEKGKYYGYTAKALWKGEKEDFLEMSVSTFLENVKLLYEDASLLTKYHVLMDDFNENNVMVTEDQKIYIIDPGYFICYPLQKEKEEPKDLEKQNDLFIRTNLLFLLSSHIFSKKDEFGKEEFMNSFSHNKESFIYELMEEMKDCYTIQDYQKKILEEMEYKRVY